MNPTQIELVNQLLQEALLLVPTERVEWLQRQDVDTAVFAEVERLLGAAGGTVATSPIAMGTSATRGEFRRPDRIGPYRIISELGRGGMGAVLSAIRDDDNIKKRVAIKLVKRGMDSEELLKRFQLERQLLASLNHPNIAKVLDAGITDAASGDPGRPYFVMEYVEGMPLDEFCDVNELNTDERLRLFQKVCSAVHAAHQALIVHRDLKPGNILVTPDGEPKLLDFGIAKLLNVDLMGVPMATLPHERLMTPEYASPEQVRGQPITTQSDIYSLGVLLYQILTGRLPYNIASRVQAEIERVVCEVEPESPSTAVTRPAEVTTKTGDTVTRTPEQLAKVRESVPTRLKRRLSGDLDKIVLMAMRKAPNRRYGSAEDFAADIGNHLADLPVKARPETWIYSASRFARRHSVGVAAAGLVVAALVVGGSAAAWGWKRASAERATAQAATKVAEQLRSQEADARRQAEDQKSRAEAANERSAKLIQSLLGGSLKELVTLPGSLDAATKVVAAGKLYTDELAKAEDGDPRLHAQIFQANLWMGDLAGGASGPGGGLLKQAIEHYQSALRAAKADQKLSTHASYVTVCYKLALAHMRAGQGKQADIALSEGEAVANSLIGASKDQDLLDARRVLASVLAAQGDRFGSLGLIEEARMKLLASISIREVVLKESKDQAARTRAMYDVPVGYSKLAKLERLAGNSTEAKKWFEKTLKLRKDALAAKSDEQRRRAVMLTTTDLANVLLEMNEVESAALLGADAEKLAGELAAENPDSLRSRQEKINALLLKARITSGKRQWADAQAILARTVPDAATVLEQSPQDVTAMQTLAELRTLHADVLNKLTRKADAAVECSEASQVWRNLLLQDPSQIEVVRGFAAASRSLIDMLAVVEPARSEQTRASALKTLQDAQALLEEPSTAIAQGIEMLRK